MESQYLKKVVVRDDLAARVGLATVRIGEVEIRGVAIWKSPSGKLCVDWPAFWDGVGRAKAIWLPPELRTAIEAEVIAAYEEAQQQHDRRMADKRRNQTGKQKAEA